jgi:hypothetical protein
MLELAMATSGGHEIPAFRLEHLQGLADFHTGDYALPEATGQGLVLTFNP